jgi:hypothetical protein
MRGGGGDEAGSSATHFMLASAWSKRYPAAFFTASVTAFAQDQGDGRTRYKIAVQCSSSAGGHAVWLRYSELRMVHDQLRKVGEGSPSPFPPKTLSSNPSDDTFLEQRRAALSVWLDETLEVSSQAHQIIRTALELDRFPAGEE